MHTPYKSRWRTEKEQQARAKVRERVWFWFGFIIFLAALTAIHTLECQAGAGICN